MPRNRNKYRRESLTEVRVNGQNIRVSPYLAQYNADGKGEAEHVHVQMPSGQRLLDVDGLQKTLQGLCQWRVNSVFLRR